MEAETAFQGFQLHRNLKAVDISCPWCGAGVPLPDGDFSGVCIECGTVVFRGSSRGVAAEETDQPTSCRQSLSAPAV